jgi:hypothetical protein
MICAKKPKFLIRFAAVSLLVTSLSVLAQDQSWVERESKELQSFLDIDRLEYYSEHLAVQLARKGNRPLAQAVAGLSPQDFKQKYSGDPRVTDLNQWDRLVSDLVIAKNPALKAQAATIVWNYPFFKKKLAEAFTLLRAKKSDAIADAPELALDPVHHPDRPAFDEQMLEPIDPTTQTLDAELYAAWKTTRGPFWYAQEEGKVVELQVGDIGAFADWLTEAQAKVVGEVRAHARNYNRVFVVALPGDESLRVVVTGIEGRDRLEHLKKQTQIVANDFGKRERPIRTRVTGQPGVYHRGEVRRLQRILGQLPRADEVWIGQLSAVQGAFEDAALMEEIVRLWATESAQLEPLLTPELKKVVLNYVQGKKSTLHAFLDGSSVKKIKLATSDWLRTHAPRALESPVFNTLDLGGFTLVDLEIRGADHQPKTVRLVSNTWGDQVWPLAIALKQTGHREITYMGTAGSLPGSGLKVGDVVTPRNVQLAKGKSQSVSPVTGFEGVKVIDSVAHVDSPFSETHEWLNQTQQGHQAVEIETSYLAQIFKDRLKIALFISDEVGSEIDTLAQSGTNSSRQRAVEKFLAKLISEKVTEVRPSGQEFAYRAKQDFFWKNVQEIYPNRDVLSQFQLVQAARSSGAQTAEQLRALGENVPGFTTKAVEQALVRLDTGLSVLQSLFQREGLVPELYLSKKGLMDGSWNPKVQGLDLLIRTQDASAAEKYRTIIDQFKREHPVESKTLLVKLEQGPPPGQTDPWVFVPHEIVKRLKLSGVYSQVLLELGGLVLRETRSGKNAWDRIEVGSQKVAGPIFDRLAYFAPDEETRNLMSQLKPGDENYNRRLLEGALERMFTPIQDLGETMEIQGFGRNSRIVLKVVDQLPEGDLARIDPYIQPSGEYGIQLQITRTGLKNPLVILEELVHIGQIAGGQFNLDLTKWSPLMTAPTENVPYVEGTLGSWVEMVINARGGSMRAQAELLSWELKAQQTLKYFAVLGNPFLGNQDAQQVQRTIDSRIAHIERKQSELKPMLETEVQAARRAWEDQRKLFDGLEGSEVKKLNDLVRENKRAEVRALIEKYLPWSLMEPVERTFWTQWLDAIEHPNWAASKVIFRGMAGDPFTRTADGKFFQFSTALSKNQGNYNRRLRSLQTARDKNGAWSMSEKGAGWSLTQMMTSHASDPQTSLFLSFSNLSVAQSFSTEGDTQRLCAVRVDPRRVLPNFMSSFESEIELLVPLVIFPDEVVKLWEGSNAFSDYRAELSVLPNSDDFWIDSGTPAEKLALAQRIEKRMLEESQAKKKKNDRVLKDLSESLGLPVKESDFFRPDQYTELLSASPDSMAYVMDSQSSFFQVLPESPLKEFKKDPSKAQGQSREFYLLGQRTLTETMSSVGAPPDVSACIRRAMDLGIELQGPSP